MADQASTLPGGVSTFLHHWFRPAEEHRSPQQLERERYLLLYEKSGLFRRAYVVLPCLLVQACIGSFYCWSIFNATMDAEVWKSPGDNAKAFLAAVACYGLSTSTMGAHIGRIGPFVAIRRSTVLVPLAWALAALASKIGSLPLLIIGFGCAHGPATAFGYISTTSMMQKWFPEAKGAAAGLAVAGFSVGAFVWTLLGKALMDPNGSYRLLPWQVQLLFAGIFLSLLLVSLPFVRLPPPGWAPAALAEDPDQPVTPSCQARCVALTAGKPKQQRQPDEEYTLPKAAKQLEFVLLAILVFGSSMPGVVFLSSAADMALYTFGVSPSAAGTVTALQNLINFSGRIMWGLISDRLGRKSFYLMAAMCQTIAVALMPVFIKSQSFEMWALSFLAIGSLYGGTFGVLPALCAELFGPGTASGTHGIMISLWSLSAVIGIPIFSAVAAANTIVSVPSGGKAAVRHPSPEAYIINSQWLLAMPLMATVAALLLTPNLRDRVLRKHKQQMRIRLPCSRVFVVGSGVLNRAQQEDEWIQYLEYKDREQSEGLKTGLSQETSETCVDTIREIPPVGSAAVVDHAGASDERDTVRMMGPIRAVYDGSENDTGLVVDANPLVVAMSPIVVTGNSSTERSDSVRSAPTV